MTLGALRTSGEDHVWPPSVEEVLAGPNVVPLEYDPTATQYAVPGTQETPDACIPAGSAACAQVVDAVPDVVVYRSELPTPVATHELCVGHDTDPTPGTSVGLVDTFQLEAAFVVV
jgi:hypothetical protein